MTDRNYEMSSGDKLVAVRENNKLAVINEALLPLYLNKVQKQIFGWKHAQLTVTVQILVFKRKLFV